MEKMNEKAAAIALALELYLSGEVHDIESGVVTIRRNSTEWSSKALTFRKMPVKRF